MLYTCQLFVFSSTSSFALSFADGTYAHNQLTPREKNASFLSEQPGTSFLQNAAVSNVAITVSCLWLSMGYFLRLVVYHAFWILQR